MSLLICWVFLFSLQLPLRGCAQHPSSITIQVALGVKLDLAGLKEVPFLLRQATGTGQVRMTFQFYSVCHHQMSENFSLHPVSKITHMTGLIRGWRFREEFILFYFIFWFLLLLFCFGVNVICIELQSFWFLHLIVSGVCVSLNFAGGDADSFHKIWSGRAAYSKNN